MVGMPLIPIAPAGSPFHHCTGDGICRFENLLRHILPNPQKHIPDIVGVLDRQRNIGIARGRHEAAVKRLGFSNKKLPIPASVQGISRKALRLFQALMTNRSILTLMGLISCP
ncbi:MAG: hypothetical protein KAR20_27365 [Candidatus Heimdallarchaeota archaeon]|nr:hypothetical protein [Candidatus Heimdallarchaeota archaeon]